MCVKRGLLLSGKT